MFSILALRGEISCVLYLLTLSSPLASTPPHLFPCCVAQAFIPFEVKSLSSLRILNLRNNRLTMFPSDICAALNELEELNLAQNEITYLPENISALSNVRKLILSKNKLSALPMGVFNLPALQELR